MKKKKKKTEKVILDWIVDHHREGMYTSLKIVSSAFTEVVQWIEVLTLVVTDSEGRVRITLKQIFRNLIIIIIIIIIFKSLFYSLCTCVVHIASNIIW